MSARSCDLRYANGQEIGPSRRTREESLLQNRRPGEHPADGRFTLAEDKGGCEACGRNQFTRTQDVRRVAAGATVHGRN